MSLGASGLTLVSFVCCLALSLTLCVCADHQVKTIISYPASTGRNFDEILRVIDSLQLAVSHKVATPADWTKGKDVVVLPSIPTDEAKKIFAKGITEVRPWLRTTPDPSA